MELSPNKLDLNRGPPKSLCVFCLRCEHNEKSGVLNGKFFKLLNRFVGHGDDVASLPITSKILPLSSAAGDTTSGSMKMGCCEDCELTINGFCDLYHKLVCLELHLEWKLATLVSIMKLANKVPSRVRKVKEIFQDLVDEDYNGGSVDGNGKCSQMEDKENTGWQKRLKSFKTARYHVIKKCAQKLSKSKPRVVLQQHDRKTTTALPVDSESFTDPKNDEDHSLFSKRSYFLGWVMSFTAVSFLALEAVHLEKSSRTKPDMEELYLDFNEEGLDASDSENMFNGSVQDNNFDSPALSHLETSYRMKITSEELYFEPAAAAGGTDFEDGFVDDVLEDGDKRDDNYLPETSPYKGSDHQDCPSHEVSMDTPNVFPVAVEKTIKKSSDRISKTCDERRLMVSNEVDVIDQVTCEEAVNEDVTEFCFVEPVEESKKPAISKETENIGTNDAEDSRRMANKSDNYDEVKVPEAEVSSILSPPRNKDYQTEKREESLPETHGNKMESETSPANRYSLRKKRKRNFYVLQDSEEDEREAKPPPEVSDHYSEEDEESSSSSETNLQYLKDDDSGNTKTITRTSELKGCRIKSQRKRKYTARKRRSFERHWIYKYDCPLPSCSMYYSTSEELDAHKEHHGSFKCNFCDVVKPYAPDLALHELEHAPKVESTCSGPSPSINTCSRCSSTFQEKGNPAYIRHFLQNHLELPIPTYKCPICSTISVNYGFASNHFQTFHETTGVDPSKIFKCDQCPAYFLGTRQLIWHRTRMHFTGKCPECGKSFRKGVSLKLHMQCMHPQKLSIFKFVCDISGCKQRFLSQAELVNHKSTDAHSKDGLLLKCSKCDKVFQGRKRLNIHMRFVHNPRCYKCPEPECGKSFKSKMSLNTHLECHVSKDNMVKCPKCDQEFKSRYKLKKHMDGVHTNRSHICPQCGKTYKTRLYLSVHMEYHKGPDGWKFQCSTCDKKFADRQKLDQHSRTHTKEKPFICQFCGNQYAHRHNWKHHMNTKHKEEYEQLEHVPMVEDEQRRRNFLSRKGSKKGECITAGENQN